MKLASKVNWRWPKRREILIAAGAVIVALIILQFIYPGSKLLPGTKIHDVKYSAWDKSSAQKSLEQRYQKNEVAIILDGDQKAISQTAWSQLGLQVDSQPEVQAYNYPWYMRLVPTSVLWYGHINHSADSNISWQQSDQAKFIDALVGKDCQIKPINAGIKPNQDKLEVTEAVDGGTCKRSEVDKVFSQASPDLDQKSQIDVPVKKVEPKISNKQAEKLVESANQRLASGITIQAGDKSVKLDSKQILPAITSRIVGEKLQLAVDASKSEKYLNQQLAKLVNKSAGVTHVKTRDFTEISREEGGSGQQLDIGATGDAISKYLSGASDKVVAQTRTVPPKVEYTRTYSKTDKGLSALIKNYAVDHKGTYGVQLIELSGKRRRAGYNENKTFVTASTYKLYVAYGTLKKVEAGSWKWSDSVSGGRNLETCFDDMIVKSDNACAEAMLEKLGYTWLTNQIHGLGLNKSSFVTGDRPTTTAGDLATFMALLQSKQLSLKSASYDRFIGALKRNIHRQGIPAGASGTVADKVGFLDNLLHDSAIVYSPKGTYALAIMTDGSSWANIADLTKKIEALR